MERIPFCRYRIEGTLTAKGPLHVGSGLELEDRITRSHARVMGVVMDDNDRPYIPATTLKGRLHQWAKQSGVDQTLVRELFGTGKKNEERGGRLMFHDALLDTDNVRIPPLFENITNSHDIPLDWNLTRSTYVMASTVINRVTGTARENKLYHYEVVPEGMVFKVIIDGEALLENELVLILEALERFRHPEGITLGGMTAHGFGAVEWKLDKVSGISTKEELGVWLEKAEKESLVGFEGFTEIANKDIQKKREKSGLNLPPQGAEVLTINLEITFDGPFMINDPSQAHKSDANSQDGIDHVYLKDSLENIVLTGKSLHGAIRSQAERIVRTIAEGDVLKKACYIDSRDIDKFCKPIASSDEIGDLCITCRLFGGNGWRSPVTIPDFSPAMNGDGEEYTQDFVAIDRFTGGAADKKKFNARYRYGSTLSGKIIVNLNRIEAKHAGLLILTLRDLMEGDIPLGFGKSKGFGACSAKITGVTLPDLYCSWLEECLKEMGCTENREELTRIKLPLNDAQSISLQGLVEFFLKEVNSHAVS